MDKVICVIHPYIFNQTISVYKDEKCIDKVISSMDKLKNDLYILCQKYNIKNIELTGSFTFCNKIKEDFINAKFAKDGINIKLV